MDGARVGRVALLHLLDVCLRSQTCMDLRTPASETSACGAALLDIPDPKSVSIAYSNW